MQIRIATRADAADIRAINASAFSGDESEIVARLAVDLLAEDSTPPTISLVAVADGVAVGHVAYSPVFVEGQEAFSGYILAPLAVKPEYQKRGVGSALVADGVQRLTASGVGILLVYGDPKYYGRFGFSALAATDYLPPYPLRFPFGWQGVVLSQAMTPSAPARISCVASLRDAALW